MSHLKADLEISCLPKDLPEAIEVDMGSHEPQRDLFREGLKLPEGVTVPELVQGRNAPVGSIHAPRVEEEPEPWLRRRGGRRCARRPKRAKPGEAPLPKRRRKAGKK